jgi:4-hydroxythreonine-4-phosphate dehydrogenase
MLDLCTPIIYGSPKVATYHRNTLQIESNFSIIKTAEEAKDMRVNMLTVIEDEVKVDMGQPTPESAEAARISYEKAMEDYQKGLFDVLVTAPANQESTDPKALVVYMNDNLRVALVTKDVAIKEVSEAITQQKIIEKARLFHQSLRRDMRIANPRIAVLSLNPPSGNDGWQGEEEEEVIIPAIAALEQEGIQAFGPYAADRIFGTSDYLRFDGVLAMYYDQGVLPLKMMALGGCAYYWAGLPVVCTAPIHGPAFELANANKAEPDSYREAVYLAADIVNWRKNQ